MFRLVLGLSLVLLSATAAQAAGPKVAVVDIENAMSSTEHWKKVVAVLQKERSTRQAALEAKQKELKDKKDKLDALKAVSDPKAAQDKEMALYKDAQELTQGFMKAQKELSDREKKATDGMMSRFELIVREIAMRDDYDFVFETGSGMEPNVLYAPKTANITAQVIEMYGKRFKDKPLDL